jgi:hypothetical protein
VIAGTDGFRMLLGRGSEQVDPVEKTDARPMGDLVLPSLISHLIPIYIRNRGGQQHVDPPPAVICVFNGRQ